MNRYPPKKILDLLVDYHGFQGPAGPDASSLKLGRRPSWEMIENWNSYFMKPKKISQAMW
jgi:hypothetical protein